MKVCGISIGFLIKFVLVSCWINKNKTIKIIAHIEQQGAVLEQFMTVNRTPEQLPSIRHKVTFNWDPMGTLQLQPISLLCPPR